MSSTLPNSLRGSPTLSSVALTIQAASIDTRTQQRDDHLRSADFFATDGYPELSFTSTAVERDDWGLTYNQALETGGWVVGKEIKITPAVEAVLQA